MTSEKNVSFTAFLASGIILAAVLILPVWAGLTPIGSGVAQAVQTAIDEEFDYCAKYKSGVNCGCFSQKAGQIMAFQNPEVLGYKYAHKQDLARGQASSACS